MPRFPWGPGTPFGPFLPLLPVCPGIPGGPSGPWGPTKRNENKWINWYKNKILNEEVETKFSSKWARERTLLLKYVFASLYNNSLIFSLYSNIQLKFIYHRNYYKSITNITEWFCVQKVDVIWFCVWAHDKFFASLFLSHLKGARESSYYGHRSVPIHSFIKQDFCLLSEIYYLAKCFCWY